MTLVLTLAGAAGLSTGTITIGHIGRW